MLNSLIHKPKFDAVQYGVQVWGWCFVAAAAAAAVIVISGYDRAFCAASPVLHTPSRLLPPRRYEEALRIYMVQLQYIQYSTVPYCCSSSPAVQLYKLQHALGD
jgi:hypothetical protein